MYVVLLLCMHSETDIVIIINDQIMWKTNQQLKSHRSIDRWKKNVRKICNFKWDGRIREKEEDWIILELNGRNDMYYVCDVCMYIEIYYRIFKFVSQLMYVLLVVGMWEIWIQFFVYFGFFSQQIRLESQKTKKKNLKIDSCPR